MAQSKTHQPTANNAAVISSSGSGLTKINLKGRIYGVHWSYSGGDPGNGSLDFSVDGVSLWSVDIAKEGPGGFDFASPIVYEGSISAVWTLADGGSGITGQLNLLT